MEGMTITGASDAGIEVPPDDRVIEVRDLRMRYGTRDVLDGVHFTARQFLQTLLRLVQCADQGVNLVLPILQCYRRALSHGADMADPAPAAPVRAG